MITDHAGKKYLRTIVAADGSGESVQIDVYAVLVSFDVRCPARQHAIKKLLCAGQRGKGDAVTDVTEAMDACQRAIELAARPSTEKGGDAK